MDRVRFIRLYSLMGSYKNSILSKLNILQDIKNKLNKQNLSDVSERNVHLTKGDYKHVVFYRNGSHFGKYFICFLSEILSMLTSRSILNLCCVTLKLLSLYHHVCREAKMKPPAPYSLARVISELLQLPVSDLLLILL